MKTYSMTVPYAGSVMVMVEAESDEEAIEKAVDAADEWLGEVDFRTPRTDAVGDVGCVAAYRSFGRGNINHVDCYEVSIDYVESDEEDEEESEL